MTNPDIASVAKALSKVEASVLLLHEQPYEWRWPNVSAKEPDSWQNAGRSLKSLGLIEWHPNPRETATKLTRVGLAVRAFLTTDEQANAEG